MQPSTQTATPANPAAPSSPPRAQLPQGPFLGLTLMIAAAIAVLFIFTISTTSQLNFTEDEYEIVSLDKSERRAWQRFYIGIALIDERRYFLVMRKIADDEVILEKIALDSCTLIPSNKTTPKVVYERSVPVWRFSQPAEIRNIRIIVPDRAILKEVKL